MDGRKDRNKKKETAKPILKIRNLGSLICLISICENDVHTSYLIILILEHRFQGVYFGLPCTKDGAKADWIGARPGNKLCFCREKFWMCPVGNFWLIFGMIMSRCT